MGERFMIRTAVYVIFQQNGKVLLGKRQNSGYKDGYYALIQGHVEAGEGIKDAAIREAKEEAGVDIATEDMQFVTVCHNQIETHYIDFIFTCSKWLGEIQNCESNLCAGWEWFEPNAIPENTIYQIKEYIKKLDGDVKFFEMEN